MITSLELYYKTPPNYLTSYRRVPRTNKRGSSKKKQQQHREARVIAAVFKGAPIEVAQHRRNTIIGGVSICNPPCCPPLHHFYLVYIFLVIRAPHGGGIFNFGSNKCFIG